MPGTCDLIFRVPAYPCPKHGDKLHRCEFQDGSAPSHTPFGAGAAPEHICACGAKISPDGAFAPPPQVRAILCPAPRGGFLDAVDRKAVPDVAGLLRARSTRTEG